MWKDFKEEKPRFGIEVIAYNSQWVDPDFNPRGIRVGFLGEEGFTSAYWWDDQDDYIAISESSCESNPYFFKNHIKSVNPEYWMDIPNFEF